MLSRDFFNKLLVLKLFFFLVSEIWAEAEEGKRYSGRIKSQV